MADTPKQFVGFPTDRDMTEEEMEQFADMLFDAINVERDGSDAPVPPEETPENGD